MTNRLREPTHARLRAALADDADAVVNLYRQTYGEDQQIVAREQVLGWLASETIAADFLRVLEANGVIVGYGDITMLNGQVALEVAAPGVWDAFLDWAEHVGRSHGLGGVFFADHGAPGLIAAARSRGFRRWTSAYTMQLGPTAGPQAPHTWPTGFSWRTYRPGDAPQLRRALNEAFEGDPFFHQVSAEILRDSYVNAPRADPAVWLLAFSRDQLAGFAISTPGQSPPESGEINMLGVLPAWRRQGLGSALLSQAIDLLWKKGDSTIELDVDASNDTGALRLYMKAGMRVVQETPRWKLELRALDHTSRH